MSVTTFPATAVTDPLVALSAWCRARSERTERPPLHDARLALRAAVVEHRERAREARELVALVADLVTASWDDHAALEQWVDSAYLARLEREWRRVDVAGVHRLTALMDRTVRDGQAVDATVLAAQREQLELLEEELRFAAEDLDRHLESERTRPDLPPARALRLERAATSTAATSTAATSTATTSTTPPATGADGRPRALVPRQGTSPELVLSRPDAVRHLLGLDDRHAAEASRKRSHRIRADRAPARLGLADSADPQWLAEGMRRRLTDRIASDTAVADVVGHVPGDLQGVLPGHWNALRALVLSALLLVVDQLGSTTGRPWVGDLDSHLLLTGLALADAAPRYLPVDHLPTPVPAAADPRAAVLPPGLDELVVVHDRPLDIGAGLGALLWIVVRGEDGRPEELAQVLVSDGAGRLEMTNVRLDRGPAAAVAAGVLAAATTGGWERAAARTLPGRPGEACWAEALRRSAGCERLTGSLAGVHRRGASLS